MDTQYIHVCEKGSRLKGCNIDANCKRPLPSKAEKKSMQVPMYQYVIYLMPALLLTSSILAVGQTTALFSGKLGVGYLYIS